MKPRGSLIQLGRAGLRIAAVNVLKRLYRADSLAAAALVRRNWIPGPLESDSERARLDSLRGPPPGLECPDYLAGVEIAAGIPFVYESLDAPHLERLRQAFDLAGVIRGPGGEYQAMIRLATWLGSRWDHGLDAVPGGSGADLDAVETIREGMRGKMYWCEIAAKVAVEAFTAMGWPARMATASRDGFTWEHALVEAWCDEYSKWVAMDTDFNVCFEADGVPLSCFDLCHDGPELRSRGRLTARILGAAKPGLPLIDLLPYFAYVHIDLRSDWRTRRLRAGSPAGGDLATWWTARAEFGRLLTPKRRMDARARFDWPVNRAWTRLEKVRADKGGFALTVAIHAYAPFATRLQFSLNGDEWRDVAGPMELLLTSGEHRLSTRVVSGSGWAGKAETLHLRLP